MTERISFLAIFVCFLFSSCGRCHLYVQQMSLDRDYLASSHVGSPDRRQNHPPKGQRLLISWHFPFNLFVQQLHLVLTARFSDQTELTFEEPIQKSWGYAEFQFPHHLLTYRIQVINHWDEVVEIWEHQLWTQLIDIESKNSVSSQPIHGSVIDTPYSRGESVSCNR